MHRQLLGRVAAVLVALVMPAAVAANYSSPAYTVVDTGGWRMATLLRSSPSQVGATAVPSMPPPFPTTGGPRNATQTAAVAAYTFTAVVVPTASMITAGPSATAIYTISPTSTMLVPAGAARVMPQAVPVDDVVRGAVTVARVDVPDVVVIYPGGIAAFPGLTPGSGFFRVVVDTLLLTYRIEACAAEYANRVLVEERPGVYRALGCAAAECRQMLLVERGLIHIAPCYGDDCRRKIVCQARACRAVLCRNDCYQVQLCEPRGCRTAMPAAFSADDAVGSGLALAKQPPVGQGVVVGLIRAAVAASARSLAGSSNEVAPAQHAQHGRPLRPIRGNGFGPARPEPGCGCAGHGSSAEHGPTRLHAPDAPSRPERQASAPAAVALGRGSGPLAVALPGLAAAVGLALII